MAKEQDLDIDRLHLTDMEIHICGSQQCGKSHSYGPAVRDYFLIHYIHRGKGIFKVDDNKFELNRGQGFVIWPHLLSYYQADQNNPWQYSWIGFTGLKAEDYLKEAGISREKPYFRAQNPEKMSNIFLEMSQTGNLKKSKEIKLLGLLYFFFAEIIEDNKQRVNRNENLKGEYLKKAVNYIDRNYSRPDLKISDIASYLNLNRSYLWQLFDELLNVSPQQYLIEFRMEKAALLLKNYNLKVRSAALSVGYEDPFSFSKIFKKIMGKSPSLYKNGQI
ncbi:AraC-like DNA-binding protein [Halanaerobium saccharolyticum]|uniref:AraC-like DNA-binding protein n=1 Tax=Halanaerobium saccharolyticum TaxID=43595 RepID=A0A4R7Z158_9FIRM|nr:AraC family transcriptional regulator [Halanaerobium saccharolyticum]RAK07845.1 AraC-like DNA-binding protein [Halanaerobium saccharolyticum]TDW04459.1 AraC-like DNA-binding protein [Halanaerobium saccharolyticum]TDX59795.1 AraC-like DNA-binding protein [Halanaerobium saccharolyticum]